MRKYYLLLSIAPLSLATMLFGTGCTMINPGTASIVDVDSADGEELAEIVVADAKVPSELDEETLANLTPESRELLDEMLADPELHPIARRQTLALVRSQARKAQLRNLQNEQVTPSSVIASPATVDPITESSSRLSGPDYFAGAPSTHIGSNVDMSQMMLQQMGRQVSQTHNTASNLNSHANQNAHLQTNHTSRQPDDIYIGREPNRLTGVHEMNGLHEMNTRAEPTPPPIPDTTDSMAQVSYNAPADGSPESSEWNEHLAKTRAALAAKLEGLTLRKQRIRSPQNRNPGANDRPIAADELTEEERGHLQAKLRIIDLLIGRKESALEPIVEYDENLRQYLSHQLQSLSVILDPAGIPIPERRSAIALRSHREAERYLSNRSQLDLENVSFCDAVNGFGDISEFPSNKFSPDQRTLLYVEIRNMTEEDKGNGFETELQGSYEIFDATGRRVANRTLPLERGRCSNFRRDYYIAYLIYMPQRIQDGEYTLQLTIEDLKGKKFGQATVGFTIGQ